MKTTVKFFALLTVVLTLAACNKDKDDLRHERDIVYIVDADQHNAHLETDSEFDALLDDFCDFAKSGSTVTFYKCPYRQVLFQGSGEQGGDIQNNLARRYQALDAPDGERGQNGHHHL